MANKMLIIVIAVVLLAVVTGSIALICNNSNFNPTPTPTPTPQPATPQEQIRDAAMSFIKTNHTETAFLLTDLNWTGGRQATDGLGAETYIYESGFWTVVIEYPVVPDPVYTIYVDFSRVSPAAAWQGTSQNGSITENHFTYTP